MLPKLLWLAGSFIFFLLGSIHLYYTFFTRKLDPRNDKLLEEMNQDSPRLTRATTIRKAWVGFNASHSAGAIFIGLINLILCSGYFYIVESSFALELLTIITALFYLWLAKKYWFSVPFTGLLIATLCFILSPLASYFN